MVTIRLTPRARRDLDRITDHKIAHTVADVDAPQLLERPPLIGRPSAAGLRELVIGRGLRGYVALYQLAEARDAVVVAALRAQREAGFVNC